MRDAEKRSHHFNRNEKKETTELQWNKTKWTVNLQYMEIFLTVRIYASAWLYQTILICTQSRHKQMIPFKNQQQKKYDNWTKTISSAKCVLRDFFSFLIMFKTHVHRCRIVWIKKSLIVNRQTRKTTQKTRQ